MRLYNMVGYKLFKQNEEDGSVHMIRIIGMHRPYKITHSTKDPAEIFIFDYKDNQKKKVRVDSLKEYSPLKPDGIATFSVVNIRDNEGKICKDVIVTGSKFLNIELKISNVPYAVCRQNITDVFYKELLYTFERSLGYVDMYAKDEEVTFEINNNAVKQWFTRGYSKPQYEELFEKVYLRLHSVPIRYRIVVSNLPKANIYAYEDKLDKRVVHKGFDFEEA